MVDFPTESTQTALLYATRAATILYEQAWGKPWPRHTGIIHRSELGKLHDDDELYLDQGDDDALTYECLEGVDNVLAALSLKRSSKLRDVIVVLNEYGRIRSQLERPGKRAFVVTGHPGIGKSTFLIYLLLSRLEQKLPTAFELPYDLYLIFNKHGAHVRHITDYNEQLKDCWALSDGNEFVLKPCGPFRLKAQRVVQTTSAPFETWKEWRKYSSATVLIVDLPKALEIGAVLKESNLDTASTLPLVGKWGPSLSTIIDIVEDPDLVDLHGATALEAANNLAMMQVRFGMGIPSSNGSAVLFSRPLHRSPGLPPSLTEVIIPTKHLAKSFDTCSASLSTHEALQVQLFSLTGSHALGRSFARRRHERQMHRRFCIDRNTLHLYAEQLNMDLMPPNRILCGSPVALESTPSRESLYWMPFAVKFPGIDAILVDSNGDVFALQAAIAADHSEPDDGLRRAWAAMSDREQRRWNFVLVCTSKAEADALLKLFVPRMSGLILGGKCPVNVWACFLYQL